MAMQPTDAGALRAEAGGAPPASSRGARTAARLREAGLQAFAELGWQRARVEDVVQRAGVSHGTFYTYYENKSALLEGIVRASQADFDALSAAPWEAGDVRGALERVIGGFLDLYERDEVVMATWLQAARDDPQFRQLYLDSRARFVERITKHVAAAVAAGNREAPAGTVASALAAMVEHFAYCWRVLGERHDREAAVTALVLVWGSTLNNLAGFELVDVTGARSR